MSDTRQVTHPLFIPRGSVRALVTMTLVGATCYKLVQGASFSEQLVGASSGISEQLHTALFVVLAYYFAHRGAAGATVSSERPPLFLPRGVIRTLLVLAFGATFFLVWRRGELFNEANRMTLVTLISFFAGIGLNVFYQFRRRNPEIKTPMLDLFDHLKAVAVLGAAAHLGLADALGWEIFQGEEARVGALGLIAFYFGSR